MLRLRCRVAVFGLTIIASTLLVGAEGTCDEAAVKKCTEIFPNAQKSTFTYTPEELEAACKLSGEFVKCINATGCATEEQIRALRDGVKRSADYVCKQHKQEFLDNAKCFSSKNLDVSVDFCEQKAKMEPGKTPCETANRLISCTVKSVNSCCGEKAGALIDEFLRVVLPQNGSLIIPKDCHLRSDIDVEISPVCPQPTGTTTIKMKVGANDTCNRTEIWKCAIIFPDTQQLKFSYTPAELEANCRLSDEFMKCIDATGCGSDEQVRTVVDGIKRSTDYICKQHKQEFVDNAQCFNSKNLDVSVDFCKDKAKWQPDKKPCDTANRLISCTVKSVKSCCGEKAGALIDDFLKVALPKNASHIISDDCQFRSDMDVQILPLCNV